MTTDQLQPGGALGLYVTNKTAVDHRIEAVARAAVRKPLDELRHLELGDGIWYDMDGEKLSLWRFDIAALSSHLERHGLVSATSWFTASGPRHAHCSA